MTCIQDYRQRIAALDAEIARIGEGEMHARGYGDAHELCFSQVQVKEETHNFMGVSSFLLKN